MSYIASRLLNPYLTLIAGLALAGSVAFAGGGWRDTATSHPTGNTVRVQREKAASQPNQPPYRIVYIVGSQADMRRAEELEFESASARAAASFNEPVGPVRFYVASTQAEAEGIMALLLAESAAGAPAAFAGAIVDIELRVHDLRGDGPHE